MVARKYTIPRKYRATELHSISLKPLKIQGETIEFVRRYEPFSPGQFPGHYVQAYRRGYPFSAGRNKAQAIRDTRQMMRIEKNWGR